MNAARTGSRSPNAIEPGSGSEGVLLDLTFGLLCMEVLHQLDFAFTDLEPVF
ncbi:hypothetical protein [Nocardia sputorum]|uniref:Uncharacterized protein n=1 Tax=Nocardia sputorum TaxID=2984338 RepID=A0ABM8D2N2_9NOCA|nr:hypothetical protein [Nocardia sputorum]BDU01606.1 hypothetical protein IFM12276_46340 [Nocardia sputorum]